MAEKFIFITIVEHLGKKKKNRKNMNHSIQEEIPNERGEPLKSKLELYDKIGIPFSGSYPRGNDINFGTSME